MTTGRPTSLRVLSTVVGFALATVLLVIAIVRSAVGPTGILFPDGPSMACVDLADVGTFLAVAPGSAPVSSGVDFPGRLVCVWASGDTTTHDFFRFDTVGVVMIVAALLLVVASIVLLVARRGRLVTTG